MAVLVPSLAVVLASVDSLSCAALPLTAARRRCCAARRWRAGWCLPSAAAAPAGRGGCGCRSPPPSLPSSGAAAVAPTPRGLTPAVLSTAAAVLLTTARRHRRGTCSARPAPTSGWRWQSASVISRTPHSALRHPASPALTRPLPRVQRSSCGLLAIADRVCVRCVALHARGCGGAARRQPPAGARPVCCPPVGPGQPDGGAEAQVGLPPLLALPGRAHGGLEALCVPLLHAPDAQSAARRGSAAPALHPRHTHMPALSSGH